MRSSSPVQAQRCRRKFGAHCGGELAVKEMSSTAGEKAGQRTKLREKKRGKRSESPERDAERGEGEKVEGEDEDMQVEEEVVDVEAVDKGEEEMEGGSTSERGEKERRMEVEGGNEEEEKEEEGETVAVKRKRHPHQKEQGSAATGVGEDGSSHFSDLLKKQVAAFSTREELEQLVQHLRLKRTPLSELTVDTHLTESYTGGKVVGVFSGELTQGQVVVMLQDNAERGQYMQCVFEGDVTRLLPNSARLGLSELYVHMARVTPSVVESSQDMELGLNVEWEEEKVWIVSREAKKKDFLPQRDPKAFQGRKGGAKRARKRKNMEERLERERKEREAAMIVSLPVPAVSTCTTEERLHTDSPPQPAAPPPSSHTSTDAPLSSATRYSTGPNPQPSQAPSTFPDHCDIPDSALRDFTVAEESTEEETSSEDSSDESLEASSESGMEDDGEGGRGQDRKLFPYQGTISPGRQYEYKKISALEAGQQKVNVFGVVVDFKPPFQTKGRDFCSIVNIIDESSPDEPLKCMFFHPNQDKLPRVRRIGDVVCFHRLNIKLFQNGIQGISQSFTSSLCFSGRLGTKVKPITGSMSYTFTAGDRRRVKELRVWGARQNQKESASTSARCLRDVTPGSVFDLIGQVVSVFLTEPVSACTRAVLCVWDGTLLPHRHLNLDLSLFSTRKESNLCDVEPLTECVVVYGQPLVSKIESLSPGQFVCLKNVHTKTHAQHNCFKDPVTALELRMQQKPDESLTSEISVLSNDSITVHDLKVFLRAAKQHSRFRPLPPDVVPSPVTRTTHSHRQHLSLNAITKWPQVPCKFRCTVKILGIAPPSVEEMVKLRCPKCKSKIPMTPDTHTDTPCSCCAGTGRTTKHTTLMEPTYFFKLQLADEMGHLSAYASGKQANSFLSDFPPVNYFQQPKQRLDLLERLYVLTGNNDPFNCDAVASVRPWLEMCLVSMPSTASADEQVTYHLFDTVTHTTTHT